MKAFITRAAHVNITRLCELLRKHGIQYIDYYSDIKIKHSFQAALKEGIEQCDFCIVIYDADNVNNAFESGIAVGLGRPIFAIIDRNVQLDFLLDSVYVRASSDEIDKISFAFEIFIQNIRSIKKPGRSTREYEHDVVPANSLLGEPNVVYSSSQLIQTILESEGIIYERERRENGRIFDFSIWSDQLNGILGNPIILELKSSLNTTNIASVVESTLTSLSQSNAKSAIIICDQLSGISKQQMNKYIRPHFLILEKSRLLEELKHSSFSQAIHKIRNSLLSK